MKLTTQTSVPKHINRKMSERKTCIRKDTEMTNFRVISIAKLTKINQEVFHYVNDEFVNILISLFGLNCLDRNELVDVIQINRNVALYAVKHNSYSVSSSLHFVSFF